MFGGNGYINEYSTPQLWRRAKRYAIGAGRAKSAAWLIELALFTETA